MGWGEARVPFDLPADVERAIRSNDRRFLRKLLDGDLRRFAHVLCARISDPPITRDERQAVARSFTTAQRRFLRQLLNGDVRRMALFIAGIVEEIDEEDNPGSRT